MNIGKEIQHRRRQLKITQKELAADSGKAYQFIADLEQGRKQRRNADQPISPTISNVEQIVKALKGRLVIIWD